MKNLLIIFCLLSGVALGQTKEINKPHVTVEVLSRTLEYRSTDSKPFANITVPIDSFKTLTGWTKVDRSMLLGDGTTINIINGGSFGFNQEPKTQQTCIKKPVLVAVSGGGLLRVINAFKVVTKQKWGIR